MHAHAPNERPTDTETTRHHSKHLETYKTTEHGGGPTASSSVCLHVCMCPCACIYVYVCGFMYVYRCANAHMYMYVYISYMKTFGMCVYIYIYIYIYLYIWVCVHGYTYLSIDRSIYLFIYLYVCVYRCRYGVCVYRCIYERMCVYVFASPRFYKSTRHSAMLCRFCSDQTCSTVLQTRTCLRTCCLCLFVHCVRLVCRRGSLST